jgi:hypothetical protein
MFCPTCGLQQTNQASSFCSRCGFLLTGVNQVISNGGNLPQPFYNQPNFTNNVVSTRKKGLKQGGKMILAGLILVPLLGVLTSIFWISPFLVGLTAIITFWGGLLRMVYALIFEGSETEMLEEKISKFYRKNFKKQTTPEQLPPPSVQFSEYSDGKQGMWRETADLRQANYKRENLN